MDVCQCIFEQCHSEELANKCRELYSMLNKSYNHIVCFCKDKAIIFRFKFRQALFTIKVQLKDSGIGMELIVARVHCHTSDVQQIARFLETCHISYSIFWENYRWLTILQPVLFCIWDYNDKEGESATFHIWYDTNRLIAIVSIYFRPVLIYKIYSWNDNPRIIHIATTIQEANKILKRYADD